MKIENIVKRLEKEGYKVEYKKWSYWDSIPHVKLDGFEFAIAEYTEKNGWMGCNLDFVFNQVQHALDLAKTNNPILLKKIEQAPWEDWYLTYLILSMEDYYQYKKGIYPFNEYYLILEKLKKEFK